VALLYTFTDGEDMGSVAETFWNDLIDRALPRKSSNWSLANYPGDGGLHRVAWVVNVDVGDEVVLDTEADWRDRTMLVAAFVAQPDDWSASYDGPSYPGNPNDNLLRPADGVIDGNALAAGYTGSGRAAGSGATLHGYQTTWDSDVVRIFASSSDGSLRLYRHTSDADSSFASYALVILASEQLGEHSTPGSHPTITVSLGDTIEPHVLNGMQDRSMLGQVRGVYGAESDAFPLGAKLDALGIPERWTVREDPVRQPAAGMPWRYFYAAVPTATEHVIDDSIDWRDRIVWGGGREASVAIGAGGASEASHNTASSWRAGRYTGPGSSGALADLGYGIVIASGASGVQIRVRSTDGALVITNASGSTYYVTGIVGASFPLGPRSV
jgi:hypothetical protein